LAAQKSNCLALAAWLRAAEHWLNGVQLVDYELHSRSWDDLVRDSKYQQWPGYGQAAEGHIGLQDHDALVWYRNIKIRSLPGP
jgi:hypothetical protein